MDVDHKAIQELVGRLAEGLNVEVKNWISPDDPQGVAKIVRAVLALRNRNGGYLVIGFDNGTLQPDIANRPTDVRKEYPHIDKIQGLISRFSYQLFEVAVSFPELDGREYPVIFVPVGVQWPVAAKADLDDSGKKLVEFGDVYCRTLSANGTPSTAVARPQDSPDNQISL